MVQLLALMDVWTATARRKRNRGELTAMGSHLGSTSWRGGSLGCVLFFFREQQAGSGREINSRLERGTVSLPSSLPRGFPARARYTLSVGEPLCRWTRTTVLGLVLESQPSTVRRYSDFQFSFNISENSYKF
jgi:hypothetical protein